MEQVLHDVLLDFEHLALLTMVVGLLITASIRTMRGEVLEIQTRFGKIQTRFGGVDLVAALMLVAFYYLSFLPAPQQQEPLTMSFDLIVINLVMSFFLMTIVLVTVQWVGGRDSVELFGLKRVTFLQWLLWVGLGVLIATPLVLYLSEWVRTVWLEPIFGQIKEQGSGRFNEEYYRPRVENWLDCEYLHRCSDSRGTGVPGIHLRCAEKIQQPAFCHDHCRSSFCGGASELASLTSAVDFRSPSDLDLRTERQPLGTHRHSCRL